MVLFLVLCGQTRPREPALVVVSPGGRDRFLNPSQVRSPNEPKVVPHKTWMADPGTHLIHFRKQIEHFVRSIHLSQDVLREIGSIASAFLILFPGLIMGKALGVKVEHYIVPAGMQHLSNFPHCAYSVIFKCFLVLFSVAVDQSWPVPDVEKFGVCVVQDMLPLAIERNGHNLQKRVGGHVLKLSSHPVPVPVVDFAIQKVHNVKFVFRAMIKGHNCFPRGTPDGVAVFSLDG
mmetsp:Transcript_4476/g.4809  ORF Transcript_4476/g.4809 Transcript_4476/m.4809 type:complete len:233 (-) Transcript_4476:193-891(-)